MKSVSWKIQLLSILFLTLIAYSSTLWNNFALDDRLFILNFPPIRSLDNVLAFFQGVAPPGHEGVYRPLRSFFYGLAFAFWGENPFWYHLQALVVHVAATVLVYFIINQIGQIRRIGQIGNVSFIAALLFGLHPIHTEAVSYITASFDTLGMLAFLLSFYFYLRFKQTSQIRDYSLSLLTALVAFFTTEITLSLPLIILLYEWCRGDKGNPSIKLRASKGEIGKIGGYFFLAIVYIFIRFFLIHIVKRGEFLGGSMYLTMLTMAKVFLLYIRLLIFPMGLSIVHTLPGGISTIAGVEAAKSILEKQSLLDGAIAIGTLLFIAMIAALFYLRKKFPLVSFALGWIILTLLPVSQIIPIQQIMAERYLYLPSVGFVLVVGYCFSGLVSKSLKLPKSLKKIKWSIVFILATSYLLLTTVRNLDWHDDHSIWQSATRVSPQSPSAWYNLGNGDYAQKNLEHAKADYMQALSVDRQYTPARNNLASVLTDLGEYDQAEKEYLEALREKPDFWIIHAGLANVYSKEGKTDLAKEEYQKVKELQLQVK